MCRQCGHPTRPGIWRSERVHADLASTLHRPLRRANFRHNVLPFFPSSSSLLCVRLQMAAMPVLPRHLIALARWGQFSPALKHFTFLNRADPSPRKLHKEIIENLCYSPMRDSATHFLSITLSLISKRPQGPKRHSHPLPPFTHMHMHILTTGSTHDPCHDMTRPTRGPWRPGSRRSTTTRPLGDSFLLGFVPFCSTRLHPEPTI